MKEIVGPKSNLWQDLVTTIKKNIKMYYTDYKGDGKIGKGDGFCVTVKYIEINIKI